MAHAKLILLLIHLIPCFCFSQRIPPYCPFDPGQPMNVVYTAHFYDNNFVFEGLSLSHYSGNLTNQEEENDCNAYSIRYINSINAFQVYAVIRENDTSYCDSSVAILDLHQIHGLKVEVAGNSLIDLSKLTMLKHLQLSNLESLEIQSYSCDFVIRLSNWPNYEAFRNSGILSSIRIHPGYLDKNLQEDLSVFKKIKFLEVHEIVNYELIGLTGLETVLTLDPTYFFANNMAKLPALKRFNDVSFFGAKMVAERSFFLNNLPLSEFHPVYYIDRLILASGKLDRDGEVIILAKDVQGSVLDTTGLWCHILGYPMAEDTIAVGNIVDGAIGGVWRYFLPDVLYYDHAKRNEVEFPVNGYWSYYFANGQLAIEGSFKSGKKEGRWKFYRTSGELASIKTFKNDLPSGLFIDYDLYPSLFEGVENRKYFINGFHKTFRKQTGQPYVNFGTYGSGPVTGTICYSNSKGNLVKSRNGKSVKEITRGSKKYNRLLYRQYLKYLYPDSKRKDIHIFEEKILIE